nr:GON-4-like protein isoform X1 [Nothobranchius furzeri]XP_015828914.2 GON-4-like protein isoform X1 [Nothobranchius furzeri]XP_015828915.2 GON-4-like protein isoform X1 [Nothobranchius furzeri]XP_015828916.2 GON-4-like protein isoform X1 [Nothobranchius furzeri]
MNPVRKRLKLSPSKPHQILGSTSTTQNVWPPHDASLLPAASAGVEVEVEEEEGHLLVEEDTTDSSLIITMEDNQMEVKTARRKALKKKKQTLDEEEVSEKSRTSETEEEEETRVDVEIDRQLDQSLETKSKQHNLTAVNVKNIIHEVITNEHVVAMMKAAINETEAVPPFEPKMTRSKLKEVVEKGVVIPTWNISPIKKCNDATKAPQFVDIPLDDEDSSDEEYRPDEEEEDETAEDTFQESDMESTASSPRGSRLNRVEEDSCSPWQTSRARSRRLKVGLMGPPPPPKAPPPKGITDSIFLERLHAVEEELADCMEPYQPMSESEEESGVMACRTRSKRPLRNVPLGQLEAKLQAPDITPDMYDSSSAPEDKDWTDWLRGLMTSDVDNEEEGDDEDDPEYNFLADTDEPDLEDYRDDKAVRITKKEVNELMEELFETLKEDLAGQEVDEEGHEEEEEPQEEALTVQTHTLEDRDIGAADEEADDGPITELRTVRQQLDLIRRRRQTNAFYNIQSPEPYMLKLNALQKQRLQQQLQQHVQLLIQIHLLTSPVPKLHGEAETTRQFLFELDMLAQRGELIGSAGCPGFRSAFRASNLQEALELLEEMRQTPINYQPQRHKPDARGHMRCFPVMPAELAWLFATRPVFLHPELLPSASLDPAMYCPRRTAAFTSAEDCLLVLGLRNMEGACDSPKLVSQFLLRKTVVQVRRRILQCCRPGTPDNIVKTFRYQQVVRPMPVACRHVDPVTRRPPVEREEDILPLWLVRSLPVIYPTIRHFNSPAGPNPEVPPSCRRTKARHSHLAFVRSAPATYTFPPETKYPPHLPKNLDFKRLGFVLIQQHLPSPPHDSSQFSEAPPNSSPPSSPQAPLQRLLLSKAAGMRTASTVSMVTMEQIRHHSQTLAGLRKNKRAAAARKRYPNEEEKRRSDDGVAALSPPEGPASIQEMSDDVIRVSEEEVEEEGEVLLALSESSPSASGSVAQDDDLDDPKEAESGSEQEVTLIPYKVAEDDEGDKFSDGSRSSVSQQKEEQSSEETDDDDSDGDDDEDYQRESEDMVFAQDYLQRVCEVVQYHPGLSEQLLQVLDELSAVGPSVALGTVEVLYNRLSCVLQSWPQLLKDFAAFLNHKQARRCGLLLEQQLFEHSRRFLRRLGWSLGETSSIYQQVVSLLQGGSTPSSEDIDKVSSLLRHHPDLQEEVQGFFQQLHTGSSKTTKMNSATQNAHDQKTTVVINTPLGSESEEEREQRAVCAKNITVTSNGEKVIVWTREADRIILTSCQQRGANRETFRQVSSQLGNKTVQQVCLRFQELMKLFLSASQKSTSCSPEGQPLSRHSVAPD